GYISAGPRLRGAPGAGFRGRAVHEKPTDGLAARVIPRGGPLDSLRVGGTGRRGLRSPPPLPPTRGRTPCDSSPGGAAPPRAPHGTSRGTSSSTSRPIWS